jgi:hypothetical protein
VVSHPSALYRSAERTPIDPLYVPIHSDVDYNEGLLRRALEGSVCPGHLHQDHLFGVIPAAHPFESIRSLDKFLHVLCRLVRLDQTDRNAPWHAEELEPLAGVHFQLENHSRPIITNALDQPIAENDARCVLEKLDEMAAIQREPMAVGTPVRVWMIVKMISEVGVRGWAGGHDKS